MAASLLIGTPCYGGAVQVNYLQSMLRLLPFLAERGITSELKTIAQESLISRARNAIVAEFLGRPECTHLLFIDADIGFAPGVVTRLIDVRKPLACAAYPMKGYDWEAMHSAAASAGNAGVMRRAGLKFAVNLHDEDNAGAPGAGIGVVNGFAKVAKASTGMMLIERGVFETMQRAYPELRYENDVAGYDNEQTRGHFWAFFDTMLHPRTRRYLSEDYAFCHRWTQGCGGEVWLDLQSSLSHWGHAAYEGSFLGQLTGR